MPRVTVITISMSDPVQSVMEQPHHSRPRDWVNRAVDFVLADVNVTWSVELRDFQAL